MSEPQAFRPTRAELGLIHMNGRIYDPVIGRFLQADPIIQAPQNAQSHNRYSYVLNNPLSFTDPSGFSWWTKWRKPIIALAVAWAIGPMGFWSMQGGLAGALMRNVAVGVSSASVLGTANFLSSVMAGFAAGGINGGNIQSALRGALTAGILQGFSEAIGGLGSSGEAPSPAMHMGASTADGGGGYVQSPVEGMPVGFISDAAHVFDQTVISGCCKPWHSGIRDWYRSSVASFQSATVGDTLNKALGGWPAAGAIAAVSRGASAASTVSRGLSKHGGTFSTTANQAGGRVITSTGNIAQKDFATYVQSGVMRGEQVNILSGVHGEVSGVMRADMSLFHADVLKFGQYSGVNVYNMTELITNPLQIRTILNSPGTTIGGFCNSSACLAQFMR